VRKAALRASERESARARARERERERERARAPAPAFSRVQPARGSLWEGADLAAAGVLSLPAGQLVIVIAGL
jgi:septal ring factor EnvC (AmiA/AmiB activator)